MSIITKTDSYKFGGHWNMYPAATEYVYSYFESRAGAKFPNTVFFGLQKLLMELEELGKTLSLADITFAERLSLAHFGNKDAFPWQMWEHILYKHQGKLPVRIKAVPEGMPIPFGNVLMTVENTDPRCAALTNYIESYLTHVWYPSTVASLSRYTKELIEKYLEKTAENSDMLNFMLHDFGYRGATGDEAAGVGGMAHLVNFLGTDTIPAMEYAMTYYDANLEGLAYSVPATEHSIMTSLGEAGEIEVIRDVMSKYPKGILSVVADSYDIYRFVDYFVGVVFKEQILDREGIFVIRPDSVTKQHATPERLVVWILESLAKNFGYTTNSKNYKVINPKIRVLWGDGLDYDAIKDILYNMDIYQWSAENIATFGMGGGLLQKINRDTQRFAFKSSAQCRNGVWYDVFKNPLDASKISKKGKLALINPAPGIFETVAENSHEATVYRNILETVFENGSVVKKYCFDEVRKNASL